MFFFEIYYQFNEKLIKIIIIHHQYNTALPVQYLHLNDFIVSLYVHDIYLSAGHGYAAAQSCAAYPPDGEYITREFQRKCLRLDVFNYIQLNIAHLKQVKIAYICQWRGLQFKYLQLNDFYSEYLRLRYLTRLFIKETVNLGSCVQALKTL